MKNCLFVLIVVFISCNERDSTTMFEGQYRGRKIKKSAYEVEYDTITHAVMGMLKIDTLICEMIVTANDKKLDIKEIDENNNVIKYWRGFEINNVGELFYSGTDTIGYGKLDHDSLIFEINFLPKIPNDTLFYYYSYNLIKQ